MPEIIKNLICTGCSLLCDDIAIEIENRKVKKTHHVCARGYGRYYQVDFKYRIRKPLLRQGNEFQEISYEEAFKVAREMLEAAKKPFFYGWTSATSEAQREGIRLAQKYRGIIESSANISFGLAVQRLLQENKISPKLPSIKDNADLLLFWGCNPTASHIRLLSRYALLARGSNTSRGIEDRRVCTIDIRNTDMSKFSQMFLRITPGKDKQLLDKLIQIMEGKSITDEKIVGISRKDVYDLAGFLKDARNAVVFFGNGFEKTPENLTTLFTLQDVLSHKKIDLGIIPLDGGYNAIGFNLNLKKEFNLELNANFKEVNARQDQNIFNKKLKKDEIDLLFVLGADPISNFPYQMSKKISEIPIIAVDFQQTPTTKLSNLVFPATIPGVESEGTAYRLDFEKITLKKLFDPPQGIISDTEILKKLL